MMRYSLTLRRVSAFSLFVKDVSRKGKLNGAPNPQRTASALYKKLTPAQKKALERRAQRVSYPALDAYNRFQKEYAHRFVHLTNKQRQQKVAALWAELKEKGTIKLPSPAPKKIKAAAKKKITKSAGSRKKKAATTSKPKAKTAAAAPKKRKSAKKVKASKKIAKRAVKKAK